MNNKIYLLKGFIRTLHRKTKSLKKRWRERERERERKFKEPQEEIENSKIRSQSIETTSRNKDITLMETTLRKTEES